MATVGPFTPGTRANDTSFGDVGRTWSNPDNAATSNDSYATLNAPLIGTSNSNYLKCTNFSVTGIAAGDTINSITWGVERHASANDASNFVQDARLRIVIGGTIQSTPDLADTVTKWPTSDAEKTYVQSTGLPTVAQLTAADFGAALAALETANGAASVDVIRIVSIDYTPAASGKLFRASSLEGIGAGGPFFNLGL